GYVLPAAIDKGIYFALAKNNSSVINIYAADFDEMLSVDRNEIQPISGWKNYVLSILNQFKNLNKNIEGFNCVFSGDIPSGAGLSSSAAVEGGLAFALNDVFNIGLSKFELVQLCQKAEHGYPNVKCGIMDMYANIFGKQNHVLLIDCKINTHEYYQIQLGNYKVVLFNTNVNHSLASGEYNIRRQNCEEGLAILKNELNINSFRDIEDVSMIDSCKTKMRNEVFNCCKYVIEEIWRTKKAAAFLQNNNLTEFGKLMFKTHEGLDKLYNVSCAELNFLVNEVSGNSNVLGARLVGGGFGGCTINIIKDDVVNDIINDVSKKYSKIFNKNLSTYIVNLYNGTNKLM
ncbi:MAG: galactokinase, partial [Ferruginibacter sp.]|nr:galactokinase [Ferruginibacter sp.]